jgi:hypothetical protein
MHIGLQCVADFPVFLDENLEDIFHWQELVRWDRVALPQAFLAWEPWVAATVEEICRAWGGEDLGDPGSPSVREASLCHGPSESFPIHGVEALAKYNLITRTGVVVCSFCGRYQQVP